MLLLWKKPNSYSAVGEGDGFNRIPENSQRRPWKSKRECGEEKRAAFTTTIRRPLNYIIASIRRRIATSSMKVSGEKSREERNRMGVLI